MQKLILILVLSATGLFGQDNPMFDSLEYFQRNKIKVIHCKTESWYYADPFKEWSISFDKDAKTKKYQSFVYWDRDTFPLAKAISASLSNPQSFSFDDYSGYSADGESFTEIKHIFDSRNRLIKKVMLQKNTKALSTYGFRFSDSTSSTNPVNNEFVTTTNFYYADTTNKLSKIVEESPYHIEEAKFYYEKILLSMKTITDSNKLDHKIGFETVSYDYYPDRKLRRETRRVASDNCPGVYGRTECYGSVEFKYDTEFPNDSTPIPGIPYVPLITIKNNRNTELYAYIWAFPDKGNKDQHSDRFSSDIRLDSTYEIVWDPRPDRKYITQIKKNWSPIIKKEDYKGFEIIVYANPNPNKSEPFYPEKAEIIFKEKVMIESLFKKPRMITIKNK